METIDVVKTDEELKRGEWTDWRIDDCPKLDELRRMIRLQHK